MNIDWCDGDDQTLIGMGDQYNYTVQYSDPRNNWQIEQTALRGAQTVLLKRAWANTSPEAIKQAQGWEDGYEQHRAADHLRHGGSSVAARNRRHLRQSA